MVSERFAGFVALLFIATLATFAAFRSLPPWAIWLVWAAAMAAVIGVPVLPVLGRWSAKARVVADILSLSRAHRSRWIKALALSLLVQGAGVIQVWLLAQSLRLPGPLTLFAVVAPLVTLLTMLPIAVNGVGVREGTLVLLLAPAGIDSASAIALGILWFGTLAAGGLIGGAIYLFDVWNAKQEETDGSFRGHSDQGRTGQSAAAA